MVANLLSTHMGECLSSRHVQIRRNKVHSLVISQPIRVAAQNMNLTILDVVIFGEHGNNFTKPFWAELGRCLH